MNQLPQVVCPKCNSPMENSGVPIRTTSKYDDCIRKCKDCGIAYSNSKSKPTRIHRNPRNNIPGFVDSSDLLEILEKSNNTRNIRNKISKAGFSTSEDAVTFTFVKYYFQANAINRMMRVLGMDKFGNDVEVYLWGCPISKDMDNTLIQKMKDVLERDYREKRNSLTEPDIILSINGYGNVIIEVKLHSGNEVKNTVNIDKYLDDEFYRDIDKAKSSQHYELVRNWSIGNAISTPDKFLLVNLGKQKLFTDKNATLLQQFKESLHQDEKSQFAQLSWENVISRIDEQDSQLQEYLLEKIAYR